jgi:hypothetical protein
MDAKLIANITQSILEKLIDKNFGGGQGGIEELKDNIQ